MPTVRGPVRNARITLLPTAGILPPIRGMSCVDTATFLTLVEDGTTSRRTSCRRAAGVECYISGIFVGARWGLRFAKGPAPSDLTEAVRRMQTAAEGRGGRYQQALSLSVNDTTVELGLRGDLQ